MLAEIWPGAEEVSRVVASSVKREMFQKRYATCFTATRAGARSCAGRRPLRVVDALDLHPQAAVFDGITRAPVPVMDIRAARVLALLGDSVTTITSRRRLDRDKSPAGRC